MKIYSELKFNYPFFNWNLPYLYHVLVWIDRKGFLLGCLTQADTSETVVAANDGFREKEAAVRYGGAVDSMVKKRGRSGGEMGNSGKKDEEGRDGRGGSLKCWFWGSIAGSIGGRGGGGG